MTDASYAVTLYKLFLGDQQDPTGHYRPGYTIHSITCAIFPKGTALSFGSVGMYTKYDFTGFTAYDVTEGDVILDEFEQHYPIKSLTPWTVGNQFQFYELELEEKPVFPFLSGFFGFEDTEHGEIGYEFEDGFERGTWAL